MYTLSAATAVNGSPDDSSMHYDPPYYHVNTTLQEKTQEVGTECWELGVILSEKREENNITCLDSSECSLNMHTCALTTCYTPLLL